MEVINKFACSYCHEIGNYKLIEPIQSKFAKGFAKDGFQGRWYNFETLTQNRTISVRQP